MKGSGHSARTFWASAAGVIVILIIAIQTALSTAGQSSNSATPPPKYRSPLEQAITATPAAPATAVLTVVPTPTPAATPTPALRSNFDSQPLAIMIDNQANARPQTGIIDADVVYEAVTEAGITRFMAIFANKSAEVVGPIRSGRHYFMYWASEYDAIYVFAGASPQGYVAADNIGISRIDFTYGEGKFWRSSARPAPHNLYASVDDLRASTTDKGRGSLGPISFKNDSPASGADEIVITHPDGYRVGYVYNKEDNSYLRYMLRQVHADASNGIQYHPKNVIVQIVDTWRIPGDTAGRVDMDLIGNGPAYYFLDGRAIEGAWRKNSITSPTLFLDERGQKMAFNVGQTWIQIVPSGSSVSYH